jgi:predicted phage terminase large subunit-like protein
MSSETSSPAFEHSPADLEALLQQAILRKEVRSSMLSWCQHQGFVPATHQRFIVSALQDVASGATDRLALFLPPGSAKSTYASILFPPFWLAHRRGLGNIIAASHTAELATRFGRRVRNLIADQGELLGLELSEDSTAAHRWGLDAGGEYYAAGVDTGIAGFRADLAIIDDPVRSSAEADSQPLRDRHWDWYKSDLMPRLKPGAAIVLIMTRWHEDDLAGRILAEDERTGGRWRVISLPAEALPGDALGRAPGALLWADDAYGYSLVLAREKATQTPRNWSALYQQAPAPDTGNFFHRDWLRPYERTPPLATLHLYGGSDYAVTSEGGDYTVHIVVGLDPQGRLYLIDLWRGQTSSERWIEVFCDLVTKYRPIEWAEEQGQIKSGVGPFLDRRMRDRKAWTLRKQFPTRGDKAVRAQSIRGRMALNSLYVPVHAAWYSAFEHELLSFPAGKHDDQVDAMGLIGQLLDTASFGPTKKKKDSKVTSGYRLYDELQQDQLHGFDKAL